MTADGQLALALEPQADYPRYWIARRCTHWTAAHNRRFRLYRLDGPVDHCGRYPGHVWDADLREWKSQHVFGGIAGHQLDRPAKAAEIPPEARQ